VAEPPLDLRRTFAALRRRWFVVVGVTLAGVAVGAVLGLRQPASYEAKSGVLLPPSTVDSSGKPLRNILTEIRIASSAAVLGRVSTTISPRASVRSLQRHVHVRALSPDILQITADAPSPRRAVVIADAVAKQYVDYASGSAAEEADVQTSALRDQAAQLDKQLVQLESDLASGRARLAALDPKLPEAVRQSALLDSLRVSQVEAARELSALNARIADVNLSAKLSRGGIRILEPALTPTTPTRKRLVIDAGASTFTGLLLGVVLAIALERGGHRLKERDAIAEAAGAPVVVSFAVSPRVRDRHCRAVLSRWAPSAAERYALTQALARLGVPSGSFGDSIVVVTLPGDKPAALFALYLAVFLEKGGTGTALVLTSKSSPSSVIRAACSTEARRRPEMHAELGVFTLDEVGDDQLRAFPAIVTLTSVPGAGEARTTRGGAAVSILAVSSGHATGDEIAAAALASVDAGLPLHGVCVINPDPLDATTGRFVPAVMAEAAGRGRAPAQRRARTVKAIAPGREPVGLTTAATDGPTAPVDGVNGKPAPRRRARSDAAGEPAPGGGLTAAANGDVPPPRHRRPPASSAGRPPGEADA